jgi:hypothetical protein
MTARARVIAAAMSWTYDRARRLGMSSAEAEIEAFEVAEFIKEITDGKISY